MENQQQVSGLAAQDYNGTFLKAAQARTQPRSLTIEEVDGGFVVNAYSTDGHMSRFVAHNARVLGRKLKAWADPTPATPPVAGNG